VDLVGGDTTCGPLTLSFTLLGEVPAGAALRRSGAQAGDDIWVSGELGSAALALAHLQGTAMLGEDEALHCERALHLPEPRIALGMRLLEHASAAIDISDGLVGDLGHILERSHRGATIDVAAVPRHSALGARLAIGDRDLALHCLLAGGDDYELCFTARPGARPAIAVIAIDLGLPLTRIGVIEEEPGLRIRDENGVPLQSLPRSFDHFA
jgi:thiamine-monophosphate kinase